MSALSWLTTLWLQVAVTVAAAFVVCSLLRRSAPSLRYAIWMVVVVRLCVPWPISAPWGWPVSVAQRAAEGPATPQGFEAPAPPAVPMAESSMNAPHERSTAAGMVVSRDSAPVASLPAMAAAEPVSEGPATARSLHPLALMWVLGVIVLGGLALVQAAIVRRRVRGCPEVSDRSLLETADGLASGLGLRRPVRLRVVDDGDGLPAPAVLGVLRPTVLLPAEVADRWSLDRLRPLLLHELVHLRRQDPLVNAVQRWVQVLYWCHPLVWLANRAMRRERELATDDSVVRALGGASAPYLRSLVEAAGATLRRMPVAAGVGLAATPRQLEGRIRRMRAAGTLRAATRLGIAGALVLGAVCVVLAADAPARSRLEGRVWTEGAVREVEVAVWTWSDRLFEHPDELGTPLARTRFAPGEAFVLDLPQERLPVWVELRAEGHVALGKLVVLEEDRRLPSAWLRLGETVSATVRGPEGAVADVVVRGVFRVDDWDRDPRSWHPVWPTGVTGKDGRTRAVRPPVEHDLELTAVDRERDWASRRLSRSEQPTLSIETTGVELRTVDGRGDPAPGVRMAVVGAPVGSGAVSDDEGLLSLSVPRRGGWRLVAVGAGTAGELAGHRAPKELTDVVLQPAETVDLATSRPGMAVWARWLPDALLLSPGAAAVLPRIGRESVATVWGHGVVPQLWQGDQGPVVPASRLAGRVTASAGTAVAGLPVWVHQQSFMETSLERRSFGSTAVRIRRPWLPSAVTDGAGAFEVGGLAAGPVEAEVQAPGYPPAYSGRVQLDAGGTARVELVLAAGAELRLRTVDREGVPIEGVRIEARRARGVEREALPFRWSGDLNPSDPAGVAESGEDGRARLQSCPSGAVDLVLARSGFVTARRDGIEVPAEGLDLGDVELVHGVNVEGVTVGPDGRPVGGARVYLETEAEPFISTLRARAYTESDPVGRFVLRDLEPGAVIYLRADAEGMVAADPMPVEPPVAATVAVPMQLERTIIGRVVADDGRPIAGAFVAASRTVMVGGGWGRTSGVVARATCDSQGRFRLVGLGGGSFRLHGSADGFVTGSVEVDLPRGEGRPKPVEVELKLDKGAAIEVLVLDPEGRAAGGVEVNARRRGPHVDGGYGREVTGPDGRASLGSLAAGTYLLEAQRSDGSRAEREAEAGAGVVTELRLEAPGSLRGRVLRADDGSPVEGATVQYLGGRSRAGEHATRTGADGSYLLQGLPAEAGPLFAEAPGLAAASERVAVVAGEVTEVDLSLEPGGEIHGVVRGLAAAELERCQVDTQGGSSAVAVRSDGSFVLSGVPLGPAAVTARIGMNERSRTVATEVRPDAPATVEIDFSGGAMVSGAVRRRGSPVPAAVVSVSRIDGEVAGTTRTDPEGAFAVEVPGPGEYEVQARLPGGRVVAARRLAVEDDAWVELEVPDGRLEGRVVRGGRPVAGARVVLRGEGPPHAAQELSADGEGRFEVTELPDGPYAVSANDAQGTATVRVAIDRGLAPEVTIELDDATALVLRVSSPAGAVEGLSVLYRPLGGGPTLYTWADCREDLCRLETLAPGRWTLLVNGRTRRGAALLEATVPGEAVVPLRPVGRLELRAAPVDGQPWAVRVSDAAGLQPPIQSRVVQPADSWYSLGADPMQLWMPHGAYRVEALAPDGRLETHTVEVPPDGEVKLDL